MSELNLEYDIQEFLMSTNKVRQRLNKKFNPKYRILIDNDNNIIHNPICIYKRNNIRIRNILFGRIKMFFQPRFIYYKLNNIKVGLLRNLWISIYNKFSKFIRR